MRTLTSASSTATATTSVFAPGPHPVREFDLPSLLQLNYIDACAVYRKQIWVDSGGYDGSLFAVEDWVLWIQAAERYWRFHHLSYRAFDYRVRPGSMLSKAAVFKEELCRRIRDLTVRLAEQNRQMQALETVAKRDREEMVRLRERLAEIEAKIARVGRWRIWPRGMFGRRSPL